jgi:hypothetical protein
MRGGFPNQQELQVLKALGSFGSLDLDHLAERIGHAANVYKIIMDLKGIGWIRQSSNGALGPTGRGAHETSSVKIRTGILASWA